MQKAAKRARRRTRSQQQGLYIANPIPKHRFDSQNLIHLGLDVGPPATKPPCVAGLRSVAQRATDSSPACASAPVDADATAVAAGPDSLRPVPRPSGSGLPSSAAISVAHLVDPSSACALASCESPRDLRSTTQTRARAAKRSNQRACPLHSSRDVRLDLTALSNMSLTLTRCVPVVSQKRRYSALLSF